MKTGKLTRRGFLRAAGLAGAALVTGIALAAIASVYPAYVAARLAPMEAMRID